MVTRPRFFLVLGVALVIGSLWIGASIVSSDSAYSISVTDPDTVDIPERTVDPDEITGSFTVSRLVAVQKGQSFTVDVSAPAGAEYDLQLRDDQIQAVRGSFTGDAAGIVTPALEGPQHATPPPDFDLEQALRDVESIAVLNPTALYYSHFGDVEPDGQLAAYAELLESWVDSVARVRAREDDDAAVAEYFAERADTVDAWGPVHARDEERLNVAGVIEYLDG